MPEPANPEPTLRGTGWQAVASSLLLGLAAGWLGFSGVDRFSGTVPVLPIQVSLVTTALAVTAAVVAWRTHRILQRRRESLPPRQAVARLIFAKSCLIGGTFLVGCYAGIIGFLLRRLALGWPSQSLVEPIWALIAAVMLAVAGALGEWACRIPDSGSTHATPNTITGSQDGDS